MAELSVGWDSRPFNEDKPFGKADAIVAGDNIEFSQARWEAIKAVKARRATPEQIALVHETDEIMKQAVSQRS